MEIKISTENGRVPVTVMHIIGDIDSSTYESFLSNANGLIEAGARHLLVDLEKVGFMSSAGLRVLNAVFEKLSSLNTDMTQTELRNGIKAGTYKSPNLKLLKISDHLRSLFETTGFDMFIEDFTDLKTAIASFQ